MRKNGSGGGQFLTYFLLLQPQGYNFPSREEENSYPETASEKINPSLRQERRVLGNESTGSIPTTVARPRGILSSLARKSKQVCSSLASLDNKARLILLSQPFSFFISTALIFGF